MCRGRLYMCVCVCVQKTYVCMCMLCLGEKYRRPRRTRMRYTAFRICIYEIAYNALCIHNAGLKIYFSRSASKLCWCTYEKKNGKINIFPHLLCKYMYQCVCMLAGVMLVVQQSLFMLLCIYVCKRIWFFLSFSICGLLCVVFLDFNFHILAGLVRVRTAMENMLSNVTDIWVSILWFYVLQLQQDQVMLIQSVNIAFDV